MFEVAKDLLDDLYSATVSEQAPIQTTIPVSYVVCGTCQNTCKGTCMNTCSRVGKGNRR